MSSRRERTSGFSYEVVTGNGAGVHATYDTFPEAKAALSRIALKWSLPGMAFEIQRVRHLGHSRQFDMRQRKRWVPWHHKRDHTVREPDHLIVTTQQDGENS